jgi:site-specific recombinase XerD
MGGVDIKTIAELMGHESIETTQRYIHIASDHKKAAIENLPKSFFAT